MAESVLHTTLEHEGVAEFVEKKSVFIGHACPVASEDHLLHDFYFESAAMIVTLITVGKLLEAKSKGKTTNALKALMNLRPQTATVISDGKEDRKSVV